MTRLSAWIVIGLLSAGLVRAAETSPNVVIIFLDDAGYADIGPFGAEGYETPNLDRMAREGRVFTDFYAAQAVCSASRAGLLTGCYPNRIGIRGALGPNSKVGINPDETTLAEVVKSKDYATAIFGKWHLGDAPKFLPTRHGFDEYFGIPYSHDMWPKHPTNPSGYPDLPLISGISVVERNPDLAQLTTWYTEHAVRFINKNRDRPFFLYVPQSMPHVPLFVSEKFAGKTKRGIYGDVMMEIDWSVGQILEALKANGLDEKTLVVFTSDNGPWLSYGDHAGRTGGLREGKGTSFEGGQREPTVMRWPGHIPAGTVCHEPAMTIDLLPTIAHLVGARVPENIDGLDIRPLMFGESGAKSPHEALFFYWGNGLEAVRSGRWKMHFGHQYRSLDGPPGSGGRPGKYQQLKIEPSLFDLKSDPNETTDVAAEHPDVVKRLEALAEKAREDLGDSLTKRKGEGVRPPGRVSKE
jgi:arylsulfatase A-like enzyme